MKAIVFVSAFTLVAIAAGLSTDLQAGPLRERLRARAAQGGGDGVAEFGGAMSCADWAKRVDRMARFFDRTSVSCRKTRGVLPRARWA
jgi:hypothetical protein